MVNPPEPNYGDRSLDNSSLLNHCVESLSLHQVLQLLASDLLIAHPICNDTLRRVILNRSETFASQDCPGLTVDFSDESQCRGIAEFINTAIRNIKMAPNRGSFALGIHISGLPIVLFWDFCSFHLSSSGTLEVLSGGARLRKVNIQELIIKYDDKILFSMKPFGNIPKPIGHYIGRYPMASLSFSPDGLIELASWAGTSS